MGWTEEEKRAYFKKYREDNKEVIRIKATEKRRIKREKYLEEHKEEIEKVKEEKKNKRKEYLKDWWANNKEKNKGYGKKQYKKDKDKHNSRTYTLELVKDGTITLKYRCEHRENIQIHHEIYPTIKEGIIKAVQEDRIYYLCKKCHRKLHTKKKK